MHAGRHSTRITGGFLALALTVLAMGCAVQARENATFSFDILGPCADCPAHRLDTLLRQTPGIVRVQVDPQGTYCTIGYDSTFTEVNRLVQVLNESGYDALEMPSLTPLFVDKCCSGVDSTLIDMYTDDFFDIADDLAAVDSILFAERDTLDPQSFIGPSVLEENLEQETLQQLNRELDDFLANPTEGTRRK